jgi:hypothetical protein
MKILSQSRVKDKNQELIKLALIDYFNFKPLVQNVLI